MILSELMTQVRGLSYSKKDSSDEYEEGKIAVLRAGNIYDSLIIEKDYVFVPKSLVKEKQYLRRGDVLIAASSGSISVVGKAAMVSKNMNASFGAFCKVLRPDISKVDLHYFKHFFETDYYKRTIKSLAEGANINNLKTEHFDNLNIPLPPLEEQKRIAAILDTANDYRQKTKALIEKYDQLTQSLFIDMFGDPKLNPKNLKRSCLENFIKISGGSQPPKKLFSNDPLNGYVRLIQIRDYKSDKYITYIPKTSTKKFCTKDDVMIGRYGPPVFQILKGLEGAYNVALMKAIPMNGLHNTYVFYLLSSPYVQNIIIENSRRTAGQTGVNLKLLNSIEISIPAEKLQSQFAEIVEQIEKQKQQAELSLVKAEELFNSLLQKAFKGELTN